MIRLYISAHMCRGQWTLVVPSLSHLPYSIETVVGTESEVTNLVVLLSMLVIMLYRQPAQDLSCEFHMGDVNRSENRSSDLHTKLSCPLIFLPIAFLSLQISNAYSNRIILVWSARSQIQGK